MTYSNLKKKYLDNQQPLLEEEVRSYCLYLFSGNAKIDYEIFNELCEILYIFAYDGGYDDLEGIVNKLAESKHISLIEWKAWSANYAKFKRVKEAEKDNLTTKPESLSEEYIQASLAVLFSEHLSADLKTQSITSNVLHIHAQNYGYREIERFAKFFIEKNAINETLFNEWISLSKQIDPISKITPLNTSSYEYETEQDSFIDEKTYRSYKLLAITEFANFLTQASGETSSNLFSQITQRIKPFFIDLNPQQKMAIYSVLDNYANKNSAEESDAQDFSKAIGLLDRRELRDFNLLLAEFKQLIISLVTKTKTVQANNSISDTYIAHTKISPYLKILSSYSIHPENLPILARAARELELANVINTREADHVIRTGFEERTKHIFLSEGWGVQDKEKAFITKKNLSHANVIAIQALAENNDLNLSLVPNKIHHLIDSSFQYINTPLYLNICFAPYSQEVGINSFFNFYLTMVDKLITQLDIKDNRKHQSLRNNAFSEVLFNKTNYPSFIEAGLIYKASCGDDVSDFYLLSKGLSNIDLNKAKQESCYLSEFKQYLIDAGIENEFRITNLLDETPSAPLKVDEQQPMEREIMDEKEYLGKGLLRLEFNDITDPIEVGKTILEARKLARLSQNQLVENSNKKVSLRTLSKLESGKAEYVPQITTLAEIAKATGMKLKVTLEK